MAIDPDEYLAKRPESPLAALRREDLDRFSIDELEQRIAVLAAEIERSKERLRAAASFRARADGLFRA